MGQFSLDWFKSSRQKELEKLKIEEQKLTNALLLKITIENKKEEEEEIQIVETRPYMNVKLVNDVLTVVLNDGSVISKPNATVEDFQTARAARFEFEIMNIATSKEVAKEKKEAEDERARLKHIREGFDRLSSLNDFVVDGDSVYLKGINRSLPELMIERFSEIVSKHEYYLGFAIDKLQERVDKDDEFQSLKRFFMWCCLNPRAEVAHELYRFLEENSFRITKQGFFVALRNVVTLHGSNELVQFVSNTYNKVKAVWKKNPNDYTVFLENGQYKLVHDDKLFKTIIVNDTTCPDCDGVGGFYDNDWDDEFSEECERCNGTGEVEEYEYEQTVPVNHGENIGNLVELYLDLPNRAENRFTDDWTKTFDIRIGKPVTMPMSDCNWSTQDCAAAGLHFTADQIHYVGCGDQSVLVLINPMKVVGIGEHKGRCYEYLPIMTVPREEATEILHDLDFDTLALDDHYVVSELENLSETVKENFSVESQKYTFNLPQISSEEMNTIINSLDVMKDAISNRVSNVD